jgi:ribonuclease VapC
LIIDSSAILAVFFREPGSEELLAAILGADFAGIGSPTAADLHWQRAIDAYSRFGKGHHPAALNFGDCMTYATAALAQQPLLCRSDDFRKTDLQLV